MTRSSRLKGAQGRLPRTRCAFLFPSEQLELKFSHTAPKDFIAEAPSLSNYAPVSAIPDPLGLIAGSRNLPLVLAREARSAGVSRIVAIGFEGETDPNLAALVDEVVWMRVGQLGKMIQALASREVRQCVMAGQLAPKNLFDVRPDLRAMGLLLRLKEKNAHTIFGAVADELRKEGVELISAVPWLKSVMPAAGFHLGRELTAEQKSDVDFGLRIAKEVSRLEIGQSVVVKEGTVLAVEGFEGTDKSLARGGDLAGKSGGAVAIKVAKDNHDMRFDIPCVGPRTIETCVEHGINVLAFEGGRTLLLDQPEVEALLKKKRLSLLAVG